MTDRRRKARPIRSGLAAATYGVAAFLTFVPTDRAGEMLPGPIPAEIVSVVDGDTISVRAHIWLG